ncbi:MAG: hypothetical protein ACKPGT_22405 [Microcystis sp.]
MNRNRLMGEVSRKIIFCLAVIFKSLDFHRYSLVETVWVSQDSLAVNSPVRAVNWPLSSLRVKILDRIGNLVLDKA